MVKAPSSRGLFIWVLSFVMILSVYGRFFKLYLYAAIAPRKVWGDWVTSCQISVSLSFQTARAFSRF